jgi:hypothetical protein
MSRLAAQWLCLLIFGWTHEPGADLEGSMQRLFFFVGPRLAGGLTLLVVGELFGPWKKDVKL